MRSFLVLLFISIIGLGIAGVSIFYGDKPSKINSVSIPQMQAPFSSFVAGTGIVEASSKNIPIGAMFSGLIAKVAVKSGDIVKKGDLLFTLDDSIVQSKITTAKAKIALAKTKLTTAKNQFNNLKRFKKISPLMVTKSAFIESQDSVNEAEAALHLASIELENGQKELALYKVHAPFEGKILSCEMSEGAYFDTNAQNALMILGSKQLNLRVNINEYDAWRFQENTKAIAFVRGHPELKIDIAYNYTEPFIVPKTTLDGLSTEKTDTRVLQVLYTLPKKVKFPLYVGEQLDVFIQTPKEVQ